YVEKKCPKGSTRSGQSTTGEVSHGQRRSNAAYDARASCRVLCLSPSPINVSVARIECCRCIIACPRDISALCSCHLCKREISICDRISSIFNRGFCCKPVCSVCLRPAKTARGYNI